MPLQLRRGLESQRAGKTYAAGELVYITDTGALYVGNGSTAGGVAIANLPEPTIKDFTAAMFTGGSHTGITFAYNSTTKRVNATVDIELSNYEGTIKADAFKGTLVGDDSTILIDSIANKINLNGTIQDNVVPAVSGLNLGSTGVPFNNVYVDGNVRIGSAQISSTGAAIALPAGSTVGGVAIGTGTDTGYHTGDVKGSVFGDDSTILVDAVDGTLRTSDITLSGSNITTSAAQLNLGTTADPLTSLYINTEHNQSPVRIYGSVATFAGSFQGPFTERFGYRGTLADPQVIQNSDFISGDITSAYVGNQGIGGDGYAFVGVQGFGHEPGTPISNTSSFVRGFWYVALSDGTTVDFNNSLSFRPNGTLAAPILQAIPKSTTDINAITPEDGMIVFDTTLNQFKGYNGSAWVLLG